MSEQSPYVYGLSVTTTNDLEAYQRNSALKYISPVQSIDSTTPQTFQLTRHQWVHGVMTHITFHNPTGTEPITLSLLYMDALKLYKDGDSVLFKLIRYGEGTSPVFMGTSKVMETGTQFSLILIQNRQGSLHFLPLVNN